MRQLKPLTVARVRSGVVTALVCAATDLDSGLRKELPGGKFGLTLAGPAGIRRRISFVGGRAVEAEFGTGSAVLRFAGAEAMARALGGGKGAVIPIPAGASFLKAVKAFMTASKRVGELSGQRTFADEAEKRLVTEMLMTAALRGVAETAMADSWTAPKSAHMPDGIVEVAVEGGEGPAGWVRRQGNSWSSGRGAPPAHVNARLTFADVDTAFGFFTGTVAALQAMGRGTVSIRGKVPMIQVLFPLMDRFGEIMQWEGDRSGETVPEEPAVSTDQEAAE